MKIDINELRLRENQGLIRSQTNEDGLIIWTYTNKCQYDKSWDYFTKAARGLVTTDTGVVVTRPFPKFFNLHEVEETLYQNLPQNLRFEITPKLDGSLLCLSTYKKKPLITTKGSFSNIYIDKASAFLDLDSIYDCLSENVTICCEIVIPEKDDTMRRVVNQEPGVYFLAAFDNISGTEMQDVRKYIQNFEDFGFKFPQIESKDLDYVLDEGQKEAGHEGWVIRYDNGLRVKVKTWWYLSIFRFINQVNDEGIKEFILGNPDSDDWLMNIPEELQEEVKDLVKNIEKRYDIEYQMISELFKETIKESPNRKEFALKVKDHHRAPFLFMLYDNKDIREKLLKVV